MRGIGYLLVENDGGAPLDMMMLLGLHTIRRSRMATRHADMDALEYFRECIACIVEVWLSGFRVLNLYRI